MAATPATMTGKYAGRQPAITALMARRSTVASPQLGGSWATTCWGSRLVAASMASTRSGVGGVMGRPSLQPRSK